MAIDEQWKRSCISVFIGPELSHGLEKMDDSRWEQIFNSGLNEGKWIPEGQVCPSLASISTHSALRAYVDDYGKHKVDFTWQTQRFRFVPLTAVDRDQIITRLCDYQGKTILRVGFARPWDKGGEFPNKRCYLQVNGVLFVNE